MKRSLVLGVNGQDGGYLAEILLTRGHEVIGIGRDEKSRYITARPHFQYKSCDLRDAEHFSQLLHEVEPDYAFHAAAVHGASGYQYEHLWRDMLAVNVNSLHALLEYGRTTGRDLRVVYLGSCKIFAPPLSGVVDELTPVRASCLYGIGKVASRELINHYRAKHGISATNLILFNHDSVRRPSQYFLPTIVRAIRRSLEDPNHCTEVNTLDFRVDWSAATDLMAMVADVAERSEEAEFVLASGKTWLGREAVVHLFGHYGLDALRHCKERTGGTQDQPEFRVCVERIRRAIGDRPTKTLSELADEMLEGQRTDAAREAGNVR
jgi:GDPmannose 4,6-dehydratase